MDRPMEVTGVNRDFEKEPYSKDEERVAKWLSQRGLGAGDDPIGFLLASYEYIQRRLHDYENNTTMLGL